MKMPEAYLRLQRDIHDALRAQHPEWIQPDGDCPIGDWYDERFSELLWHDARTRSVIAGHGAGKTSWRIQGAPGGSKPSFSAQLNTT
jgi:hypothetical protein